MQMTQIVDIRAF